MEVDRVQLVKGLRVERTGSEQERRRRQQMEERFEDLLESTLDEDNQREQPPQRGNGAEAAPRDTVSIAAVHPPTPLVNDLVSISTVGRVSAEVHNAGRSETDPREIERMLRQQELPLAVEPGVDQHAATEPPVDDEADDQHVDTVA